MTTLAPPTDLLARVLHRLVEQGTLTPAQAAAVEQAVAQERHPRAEPAGRGRLAELLGYVGGALTAGAAALFVGAAWGDLTDTVRVSLLVAAAVALVAGALGVGGGVRGVRRVARDDGSARRRLVSTLLALAAVALAAATGVATEHLLTSALAGLGAALAGYLLCRGAPGHVAVLAGALLSVGGVVEATDSEDGTSVGLALAGVGVLWGLLAATRWVEERAVGLALGALTAFAGAQLAVTDTPEEVGYAATALLAVACFAGYLRLRDVGLLGVGVLAVTVVVPEALADWTDGSLGSASGLLVAGLSLLAASAAGLRLHRATEG